MFPRIYNQKSLDALNKLQTYGDSLIRIERNIIYIENILNINNYKELMSQISQLNGNVDKIQYEGIDSIITAELDLHSKQKIKKNRKELNSKCELIRQSIIEIYTFLNKINH